MTALLPTYSLCPEVSLDEIVRQARAVVAWAYANADRLGADRDRIVVAGHSAGAHLAAMCRLTDWAGDYGLPPDIIKAAVGISGLYDLTPLQRSFAQEWLRLDEEKVLGNSPQLLELPAAAAPFLIACGGREPEEFRRQSRAFFDRWRSHGLPGQHLRLSDEDHFSIVFELANTAAPLTEAVMALIKDLRTHPSVASANR